MKETWLTGKRRSTTIAATPDDGKSQRKRRRNQKEFRIATVAMFTCDLYAGVVPQLSPPPHDLERLRTTIGSYRENAIANESEAGDSLT